MTGMDVADLRTWWWHRQALDGSLRGAQPATVLERTGWARSVGGSNPYLSLFARSGGTRPEVDLAVAGLDLSELPSARGRRYLVPEAHRGLALRAGWAAMEAELKVLDRLGAARTEVERVAAAVLDALGEVPTEAAQLRLTLGGLARSLGPEGRRRGYPTTLPGALAMLEAAGEVRRVPGGGRLDRPCRGYVRSSPPVGDGPDDTARTDLARLYFGWSGPATLAHFRWFSGFSAAHAKAAIADLGLVDMGRGLLLPPDLVPVWRAYQAPPTPRYALLAGLDGLILLRRDHAPLLDRLDLDRAVPGDKPIGGLADLPDHPIVDRGRIVGLWQYDPGVERIVWWSFDRPRDEEALRAAVAATERYVREHLCDVRAGGPDTPRSRQPRLAALRLVGTEG